MSRVNSQKSFTLLELMIVVGLIVIFTALTLPYGLNFYRARTVEEQTRILSNILERARSHAIAGKENRDWGVFFNGAGCYVFFAGERYNTRNTVYDQKFCVPFGVTLYTEMKEVIFERHTGDPKVFTD